jgi:hypothetical protein
MQKTKVSLQGSERVVFQVAGNIYSTFLSHGKVPEGEERKWMERALRESLQLAQLTERRSKATTNWTKPLPRRFARRHLRFSS